MIFPVVYGTVFIFKPLGVFSLQDADFMGKYVGDVVFLVIENVDVSWHIESDDTSRDFDVPSVYYIDFIRVFDGQISWISMQVHGVSYIF